MKIDITFKKVSELKLILDRFQDGVVLVEGSRAVILGDNKEVIDNQQKTITENKPVAKQGINVAEPNTTAKIGEGLTRMGDDIVKLFTI